MNLVSKLNGKKVLTKDTIEVGEVSDAVMDDDWRITYLHVALNKEATHKLGHIKPLRGHVTLCLPVHIIGENSAILKLKKTIEELKVLPECKIN